MAWPWPEGRLDSILKDLVRRFKASSVPSQLCNLCWQPRTTWTIRVHVYKMGLTVKPIATYIEARPMDELDD